MNKIDKGVRLTNYLIDSLLILVISVVLIIAFDGILREGEVLVLTLFLYYFILESTTGQTLGKLITKTKVVNRNGTKRTGWRIFMRSFLRLIPIDSISYLFGNGRGFHDVLSGTRLKKIAL